MHDHLRLELTPNVRLCAKTEWSEVGKVQRFYTHLAVLDLLFQPFEFQDYYLTKENEEKGTFLECAFLL